MNSNEDITNKNSDYFAGPDAEPSPSRVSSISKNMFKLPNLQVSPSFSLVSPSKQKFSFHRRSSKSKASNNTLFAEERGERHDKLDFNAPENIGLRLALPSAMDIMTGKQPLRSTSFTATAVSPSTPRSTTTNSKVDLREDTTADSRTSSQRQLFKKDDDDNVEDDSFNFFPRSFAELNEEYVIRTSEIDPSIHQITIPTVDELLLHARICVLMEMVDAHNESIHHYQAARLFDFNSLCGLSRNDLEYRYQQAVFANSHNEQHLLRSLLECTEDLTVEAHLERQSPLPSQQLRQQVTIFSSQRYRQFIVCYRGSQEQQAKPMSYKVEQQKRHEMVLLHPVQHPVYVNSVFREAYVAPSMEEQVFAILNELSAKDPFCDVTFTGHSFGGALSIFAALRCSTAYPAMTVSCHVFGTPRVGGVAFRLLANSLPNLRIVRVENGSDPYVRIPEESVVVATTAINTMHNSSNSTNNKEPWTHSGHTITTTTNIVVDKNNGNTTYLCKALAYRFDERRPSENKQWRGDVVGKKSSSNKYWKERDHEIRSYVTSLRDFEGREEEWVTHFVGEEGQGISGIGDEARFVV